MAEEKKISIEKMDEIIRDYYPDTETVDFHGQELVVSRTIPFRTEIELVNSLTKRLAHICRSIWTSR